MKLFISWYPDPPDPSYWRWFKIDGLLVSLYNFRRRLLRKASTIGLHRFTTFPGEIILDAGSLAFGRSPPRFTQTEVLSLQQWLESNIVTQIDRPFVGLQDASEKHKQSLLTASMVNAEIARRWEKTHQTKIMYVIQGWNLESYATSAECLSNLGGSRFGIGSLKSTGLDRSLEILRLVRSSIGSSASLHLFGVCDPRKLRQFAPYVDSVDSSLPIKASFNKEIFDPLSMDRMTIRSVRSIHACPCPVCAKVGNKVYIQGLSGNARIVNSLRAIHNAYLLTQLAHTLKRSDHTASPHK